MWQAFKHLSICVCIIFNTKVMAETLVFFTPSLDCESNIIKYIDASQKSIDIVVYSINNDNIVKALINAKNRGIKIRILTDKTQAANKYSKAIKLYNNDIDLKIHTKHKIEHNKFAIFDDKISTAGSFNWTNPASLKNSETCFFFIDEASVTNNLQSRFNYLWSVNSKQRSDNWMQKKFFTQNTK